MKFTAMLNLSDEKGSIFIASVSFDPEKDGLDTIEKRLNIIHSGLDIYISQLHTGAWAIKESAE